MLNLLIALSIISTDIFSGIEIDFYLAEDSGQFWEFRYRPANLSWIYEKPLRVNDMMIKTKELTVNNWNGFP